MPQFGDAFEIIIYLFIYHINYVLLHILFQSQKYTFLVFKNILKIDTLAINWYILVPKKISETKTHIFLCPFKPSISKNISVFLMNIFVYFFPFRLDILTNRFEIWQYLPVTSPLGVNFISDTSFEPLLLVPSAESSAPLTTLR